jgi:RHS repeat-associated protein
MSKTTSQFELGNAATFRRLLPCAIQALMLSCLVVIPIKSFSQSCATAPAPFVWESASGLGGSNCTINNPPVTGTAGPICAAEACIGSGLNLTYSIQSCSAPLPTAAAQSAPISFFTTPTATGIINGFQPGTQGDSLWSIGNSACPLYWVTAAIPPMGETCSANCWQDPINPSLGNMYFKEDDVTFDGADRVAYRRFYNSADQTGVDGVVGWRHSYDRSVTTIYQTPSTLWPGLNSSNSVSQQYSTPAQACTAGFGYIQASVSGWSGASANYANGVCTISNGTTASAYLPIQSYPLPMAPTTVVEYDVIRDDGQVLRYPVQGGVISSPPGVSVRFAVTQTGFTVTDDDDNVEVYNSAGVLQSITSRSGVVQTINYDGNGLFYKATDSFGNSLTVGRNSQGNVGTITTNGGGLVQYSYLGAELSTVTNLDGTTRSYLYTNASFPLYVTGVIDELGVTYSTWGYNSAGQANATQEAGGANAATLQYNSNGTVLITDALGEQRTFSYNRVGDINKVAGISGYQCPTCQEMAATTYDAYGWVSSREDYNGNLTCYANDPVRGLELVRVEGFAPGSSCPSNLSSYTPQSGTLQRKITTVWSPTWREPTSITEPNRTTTYNLDGYGNVLTMTVTDTSVNPNVSRTWTYKYFNNGLFGHVQTLTGPRTDITTDVTSYTYFNCTSGSQCGQVNTITSAATANAPTGMVTTFLTYNAYGQPLTLTDPNSVPTTLTYDARERLTSRQIGNELTSYTYWPTGLVKLVTLPDSSTVLYAYDGAHRLTDINDALGNHIHYVLDPMGNHTTDDAYDPSGTLHRTHFRVFNTLNQLYQDINSANTSAVTTTLGYDSNNNLRSIEAPLNRNTAKQYDVLNRLSQITDPMSGSTTVGYDPNDNVASIKDPRSFTTTYSHNGFNDLTKLTSRDTGTSIFTYDSGGNLSTTTDARGAEAQYSYDALNRETQVAYSDDTINFTYDVGTNGIGRLTGASDANHSMSWAYDTHGRVTGKGQTVGGITKSVGYSYTNADLITLVTPSNQTITFGYTNHQITSITVNSTVLLNNATYDPFGPATGWTWGNGTASTRNFDLDGNPAQIVTAGVTNTYTPDAASRIQSITDSGLSSDSWSFGYDQLDRVTSGASSGLTRGYTYDANDNITTITGSAASTDTIGTLTNRLNTVSGSPARVYSYDAAGNTLTYTGETFTFNQRGRMSSATASAGTTDYIYNALGQMIEKSGNGGTTLLMYDEAGHLLGEYGSAGGLIEETIWMGDTPVATLRPNGSGGVLIYYVHTDALGNPRKVTRPSDNGLMWRWDPDTFGSVAPNGNPAGLGSFSYKLRFPGQYALSESGLNYNYFRDYDPQVGRYVESDPLGLQGGSYSTYAYTDGDPISELDPLGLWKISGSLYLGPGFTVSFGNSHGCRFFTARLGLGAGYGVSLDKEESSFPGMPATPPGPLKYTIAATVQGGARLGPWGAEAEAGAARDYGTEESGWVHEASPANLQGIWGVELERSVGFDATVYGGAKCGCSK